MTTLSAPAPRDALLPLAATLLAVSALAFGFWTGSATIVEFIYPGAVLAVGAVLYATRPVHFIGFLWAIWMVTPLVRRLVDYQALTFASASPVMLAPFLVSGLGAISVFRYGALLRGEWGAPVLFAGLGVGFGFLVGVARAGVGAATFGLLEWLVPLLVAFHVLALWRLYPEHRRIVRATFAWCVLVLGVYGVLQFVAPAPWDTHWMIGSGMTSSIGRPEPFGLRVFGTLNSPGPFAMVLMAGLLVLIDARGTVARVAAAPGFAAFLLSLVRGAWGAWLVGLLAVALGLRGATRRRLLWVLALGSVMLLPAIAYPPLVERVTDRFGTFSELGEDSSFKARTRLYLAVTGRALTNPLGNGIGSLGRAAKLGQGNVVSLDSGLLAVPVSLGWLGSALYLAGLVGLLRRALRARRETRDSFAVTACGIAVAFLFAMVFANQLTGVKGVVLWTFLALAASAGRYHAETGGPGASLGAERRDPTIPPASPPGR